MSHSRPDDTYPVLGRPVAWVPPEDLADVVEAIVATQRDFGNRDDRHRARLKYTLEEHGIDWLRAEIETRTGRAVAEPVELLPWTVDAHHGMRIDATRSACRCRPAASRATTATRSARSFGRGWSRRSGSRPARTSCCAVCSDRDALLGDAAPARRRAARRREPAAAAGDRLPGAADVRPGAGRGRARPAGGDRRAREAARRHRQRGPGDPAQHDRVPERLLPAVLRRDRHRRAHEEDLRPVPRRVGRRRSPRPARARRHPARRAHRPPATTARALRRRRGSIDGFGDWCHAQGATDARDLAAGADRAPPRTRRRDDAEIAS